MLRRDGRIWLGMLLLMVGLVLMDRSFALWRNDARNFARWDGSFMNDAQLRSLGLEVDERQRAYQGHGLLATAGLSGLVCLGISCVLLGEIHRRAKKAEGEG